MIKISDKDMHRVHSAAEVDKLDARIDELLRDAANKERSAAVARRLAKKLTADRDAIRASAPADGFKAGDFVRVRDLRDGAIVEERAKIEELELEAAPGQTSKRWVATLDVGFRVATKCLEKVS